MPDTVVEALIIDLLESLTKRERTYEEVMEAWRTSCPRLPVWEEANDRGLVVRENVGVGFERTEPFGNLRLDTLARTPRISYPARWNVSPEFQIATNNETPA
jgi:D-3-phosphoglycerate dehydrogenase